MDATEAEIRALYDRYGAVLYARCKRILGNDQDANEAVQETFAKVIANWDSFRQDASPLTWMTRISTNHCLNQVRNRRGRQAKRDAHPDEMPGSGHSKPDAPRWETAETVRRLLADCDPETRQIVICLYFDDMTRKEAGELVGLSQPTLRKRLRRFFKRARRILDDPGFTAAMGAILLSLRVLP